MKFLSHILLIIGLLALTGCTKSCGSSRRDMTPEQVVEAYLNISLNMKDVGQKEDLLALTTDNLRDAIVQASDDTLKNAFINKNYRLKNYSVVERRDRTPRETEVTFSISYNDLGDNPELKEEDAALVTTENTVSVAKQNGIWLIRDVLGKKTTIDFPFSQADEIKPAPGGSDPTPVQPPPTEEEGEAEAAPN